MFRNKQSLKPFFGRRIPKNSKTDDEMSEIFLIAKDDKWFELNSFNQKSRMGYFDEDNQFRKQLKELNEFLQDYNQQKIKFNHFRLKQFNEVTIKSLKKFHSPSVIITLNAIHDDLKKLLTKLNVMEEKCQKLLANRTKKPMPKLKHVNKKISIEVNKIKKLKNTFDIINAKYKLKAQKESYQAVLNRKEQQDEGIIKKMTNIVKYVIDQHASRYNGYDKLSHIQEAHENWLEQIENKSLSGTNYDIEYVISAFKVFLVCCLQNKNTAGCFGGFFRSPTTTTGRCILERFKHDLQSILYPDSHLIELDYPKLANDLCHDKASEEASNLMNIKINELTIQEWAQKSPTFKVR